jgi:hypothetical protein
VSRILPPWLLSPFELAERAAKMWETYITPGDDKVQFARRKALHHTAIAHRRRARRLVKKSRQVNARRGHHPQSGRR